MADRYEDLDIYLAGPGLMYVPIILEEPPTTIIFEYQMLQIEKLGYITSALSLILCFLYLFGAFRSEHSFNPISWIKKIVNQWWR
jgi:hypothetical protein